MKKKKVLKIICISILMLVVITGITFLVLDLIKPVKEAIKLHDWSIIENKFSEYGIYAYLVIGFIQAMLILITIIPAAPFQVIAGSLFDIAPAFITILSGVCLGNLLMFISVRVIRKANQFYLKKKNPKLDELKDIKEDRVLSKKVILIYFLPVVPYGLIAFTCANSKMKFIKYMLITTLGTIPSIILSITLGSLVNSKLTFILIVALLILTVLTVKYYKQIQKIFAKKPKKNMHFFQNNVRKPNKVYYWFFKNVFKLLFFKKVNLHVKNKEILKDVEGPFILLYNHPSFFDWMYAYIPLYPKKVNSIMAYYYFCNYKLGKVLYKLGAFPKFLYQPDISAIKNIKKVIKNGGILGIAPEGRLSAYGELETLAPATEKLVKHLGIPVYLGLIHGAYFTKPKWAKNIRRGRIDLEYKLVLTEDDLKTKSLEEVKEILNKEMYYDDYKWQEANNICYKAKNIAEGLENILYICPHCGSEFSITTNDNLLKCNKCNLEVTLDNYYNLHANQDFIPKTIKDWYKMQKQYEANNVVQNNYNLTSKVTLKLPDPKGKGFIEVGSGVAKLDIKGLHYSGTLNGENVEKLFRIQNIPAIPFGANENFEVYHDNTLYYFIPENPHQSVKWSVVGEALYNKYLKDNNINE